MKSYTLITGASSGFGAACAKRLAQEGRSLILIARRLDALEQLKQKLEASHNIEVKVFGIDLKDLAAIDQFFVTIANYTLDALINNAGLALGKSSFEEAQWADFNQMMDINVRALTRVTQLAIPQLKQTRGHIINISSVAGLEAYEGGSVYGGTKAFVQLLSKSLRIDLAGTGIRVTDIAPGAADTEFSKVRFKGNQTKADEVYKGYTPLYAEDIADTIAFVLSRPPHVNLDVIQIMPTAQASAARFDKE